VDSEGVQKEVDNIGLEKLGRDIRAEVGIWRAERRGGWRQSGEHEEPKAQEHASGETVRQ
jgi:hypothetical protein